MKKNWLWPVMAAGLFISACSAETAQEETEDSTDAAPESAEETETASAVDSAAMELEVPFDGMMDHVHGMGYIEENGGLYFASHHGLKVNRDGNWTEIEDQYHDFMGFNATATGFVSSGHPDMQSGMQNPLGIKRSDDGGETFDDLGFEGETDFHEMAVGYNTNNLFVFNPQANSEMETGFHRSDDAGESWQQTAAEGLEGKVTYLAMHPDDSMMIAAASNQGIFLSEDGGESFTRITEGELGTAAFFSEDALYYATYSEEAKLVKRDLSGGEEEISLPEMTEDGVVYLAQHPENPEQLAIYTAKGHAWETQDAGENWTQILNAGQVQ
ncbi:MULTISPECIES: F510_1955 family glycosylhydrolase [unclassified Planococcus (in: firmicutes)]|uniref:F510_1955 family glycosylhydrolase n=1 Tax=unclassified Planococcus (in: firmicutes) TaxID=2662419 RepID=UPI000C331D8D|nr:MULTISPECIES: hypothetical protein [unclassified Planococcus (in: firmicutes)]AUD13017.1 hypothetical protein CW734_04160 [Planococcus sp. MB-3u-03]PKG45503.1 hypothetical protein CXF66_12890 [Planococcus sp. Urea-trap-24]PKG88900.1 hypothetical protein CXF91_08645 [Planococcus sp. Urea-3u-39]PKH36268.1 hypothetical protein CXF77_14315 [Planococcus sp. MB-3u-09]